MPDPITGTGAPGLQSSATTQVQRPDQFGRDTFLKLLVAQLKYQNPTSPADSSEFLAQSAQFAVVERLEEIAKQTTETLAAQRAAAASGYLGRSVRGTSEDGRPVAGVVTGIRLDPTGPRLKVGNAELALSAVQEVAAAPAGAPPSTTPAAGPGPTDPAGKPGAATEPAPSGNGEPTEPTQPSTDPASTTA